MSILSSEIPRPWTWQDVLALVTAGAAVLPSLADISAWTQFGAVFSNQQSGVSRAAYESSATDDLPILSAPTGTVMPPRIGV